MLLKRLLFTPFGPASILSSLNPMSQTPCSYDMLYVIAINLILLVSFALRPYEGVPKVTGIILFNAIPLRFGLSALGTLESDLQDPVCRMKLYCHLVRLYFEAVSSASRFF